MLQHVSSLMIFSSKKLLNFCWKTFRLIDMTWFNWHWHDPLLVPSAPFWWPLRRWSAWPMQVTFVRHANRNPTWALQPKHKTCRGWDNIGDQQPFRTKKKLIVQSFNWKQWNQLDRMHQHQMNTIDRINTTQLLLKVMFLHMVYILPPSWKHHQNQKWRNEIPVRFLHPSRRHGDDPNSCGNGFWSLYSWTHLWRTGKWCWEVIHLGNKGTIKKAWYFQIESFKHIISSSRCIVSNIVSLPKYQYQQNHINNHGVLKNNEKANTHTHNTQNYK